LGPTTLFDKSFLQSLSVDESVWFDHFFLTNVCPLFYIETLADLEKSVPGRTPEQEVRIIAEKFPERGKPSPLHAELLASELLGNPVAMTGQILVAGGQPVKASGRTSLVFEQSHEEDAFHRWQNEEYREVERRYARVWRGWLSALNMGETAEKLRSMGVNAHSCKSLEEAKDQAVSLVAPASSEVMSLALAFVPQRLHPQILQRWNDAQRPPLADYAPYVAHVLTVELFFQIAQAAKLIDERPSSRVDISYLFYLPFCMMFVSNDRLHKRCAPLFLRGDQEFVWGLDLKAGLGEIDAHYQQLPENTRKKGIFSFAHDPPEVGDGLVAKLWYRLLPGLREDRESTPSDQSASLSDPPTAEDITAIAEAPPLSPDEVDFDLADPDSVLFKRKMRRKKGSWVQIPPSEPTGESAGARGREWPSPRIGRNDRCPCGSGKKYKRCHGF
jgi:hypothetical protein